MSDGSGPQLASGAAPARPWWRYLVWIAVGGAVVAVAVITLAFTLTAGPVKAADGFLQALARQGPAAAYDSADPQFRAVAPVDRWEAFASASGLAANTGARWSTREVENGTARLSGQVSIPGGPAPIRMTLTKDGSGWRVASLQFRGGAGSAQAAASGGALTASNGVVRPAEAAAGPPLAALGESPEPAPARPGYPTPGLDSVSVPPTGAPPSALLGARASGDGASAGRSVVPAAKVAGICMSMMQAERLPISGVECPQGLQTTVGAAARCVVRSGGGHVGMTVTLRSYDPVSTRPTLMCVVDDRPLS